ncbi:MAG: asparagine synthase (glutamine-hydrolyzing) [Myxococcales bacterium]|jgi:asparagine synthase (glutamine-hydrolysing)|nr:asparagine synthase (glutamine-hydrolyzing) [Myxococcales bacterium]
MCGIVGLVHVSPDTPIDECAVREAMRLMAHRGPDGEGLFLGAGVAIGHRRLSIVDLENGAQPMFNEDGRVCVAFNGEIYNHASLRTELIALGHRFTTRCDTEAIVHGYETWGEEVFTRLRGMFSIAIWDGRRRKLVLARDRLGIKPLYWARAKSNQALCFGSEIKSLFAFEGIERSVRSEALSAYLALRYVPGPATLFRDVERLQPGHRLVFEAGKIRIERFWELPIDAPTEHPRSGDLIEESTALSAQLIESVRLRLMSDVPLGIFLSGGIDSTAVAWAMRQLGHSPLKSFSIGFSGARAGESEGELPHARIAARACGCEHRELSLSAREFHDSVDKACWHLDEPLSDGACIPLMKLAFRAREEVTVVLSGEGADEALGGYPIYGRMLAMEALRQRGGLRLDAAIDFFLKFGGGALLSMGFGPASVGRAKLRRYLEWLQQPLSSRYFGVGRAVGDGELGEIFGDAALTGLRAHFAPLWERAQRLDPLRQMLLVDTRVWLPDDLLIKADKMTMAASIELRVPFLDHELLENAWEIPSGLKFSRGIGKRVLRAAMAGNIPEHILTRKKEGFPLPISRWLREELHEPCRRALLSTRSLTREFVGAAIAEKWLDEHRMGRVDRREELWALWVLETWRALFVEGNREAFLTRSLGFRQAA